MANKTANVTARIKPEIKEQAEKILERIGIPVSVLIDTLYRQIIITGGIPYSMCVNAPVKDESVSEKAKVQNVSADKNDTANKPKRRPVIDEVFEDGIDGGIDYAVYSGKNGEEEESEDPYYW